MLSQEALRAKVDAIMKSDSLPVVSAEKQALIMVYSNSISTHARTHTHVAETASSASIKSQVADES